ncbi:alcohol dehydrogenase [Paramyrothecium foliicola]|nr:alcohol dehydrogenase [Paramyrothecium foliicola]
MPARRKRPGEWRFKLQKIDTSERPASQPSGTPTFAFVHTDNPEQVKAKAAQRRIRRHVMASIGKSRRKYTAYTPEGCRDSTAALTLQQLPKPLPSRYPSHWAEVRVCHNFIRLFRAMDMVSKGLLSITVDDTVRKSRRRSYQRPHYNYLENERDVTGSLCEMKQYTDSIGLLRTHIRATDNSLNRHVITGTVICLAHYDVRHYTQVPTRANSQRCVVIITRGGKHTCGGYKQLSIFMAACKLLSPIKPCANHCSCTNAALPNSLQRFPVNGLNSTDVLGSLVLDARPRFPQLHHPSMPRHVRPRLWEHEALDASVRLDKNSLFDDISPTIIENALDSATRLSALLNHMQRSDAQQMALDIMIPVCQVAHDLLSLPRLEHGGFVEDSYRAMSEATPLAAVAELIRISALALVSTVITTASEDELYCAAYRRGHERNLLLYTDAENWAGREHLRLWVLVIQTLMEMGPDRAWYLDEILHTMEVLLLRSWEDLVLCLYRIAWVTHVAMKEMACLKSDIEERLARQSDRQ